MAKTKKVQMPAGIRNKLMAAVAMLLVSSIMMVSSTYAWFTLSTAPEVTGITTSVGANGNLEIALLKTETFGKMGDITSAVGDSSAVKDVTLANVTWGNLVDLSHSSYGLNLVALNPAAPNYGADDNSIVSPTTPLKTAEYGSDGRVKELKDNTVSGIYDSSTAKWIVKQEGVQTYGVRAIGVDSNMTTSQIVLNAAQAAVASGKTGASNGVTNAVNANKDTFVNLLNKAEDANYTAAELAALKDVAEGIQTSLNAIVKTYSNAVLATMAADASVTEEVLVSMRTQLSDNTSAATVSTILTNAKVENNPYSTRLGELETAQTTVANVLTYLGEHDETTAPADIKTNVVVPLIGGGSGMYAVDKDMHKVELDPANVSVIKAIYVTGGLLGTIAEDSGTYRLTTYLGYPVYAAKVTTETTGTDPDTVTTVIPSTTAELTTVATAVSQLTAANATNAEQTIADFYGYIIDFAFRTNAAGSFLQLQTEAANRVYSDGGAGTMGAGSTVTFEYTGITNQQAQTLLGAVKLVFLNTENGNVYATAKLSNVQIAEAGNIATAEVVLETQNAVGGTATAIVALEQNKAAAVSVLVYLDGDTVDNSDVAIGASSGILNLNLQFSSSAELVPMENTNLKNLAEAEGYTVTFNANGGTGEMAAVTGQSGTYTLPACTFTAPDGKVFKGWGTNAKATEYITTVSKAATVYAIWGESDQAVVSPTVYGVTKAEGVIGADTVLGDGEYTFTLEDGYTLGKVTMGLDEITPVDNGDGSYTISNVNGRIEITATSGT